jgi:uncharacterized protein (TIGR02246 family)/steroid delta-isomerase-like uncharacterized protein
MRKIWLALATALLSACAAPRAEPTRVASANQEDASMSIEHNKTLARRYWDEVINQRKVAVIDEIFAADYVQHHVGIPPGIAGIKQFVEGAMVAFPDQHATIEDIRTDGDRVITRTTIRATHSGPFRGIPPTGRTVVIEVIDIWRVENGKLQEHWGIFDNLSFMRQLGAIPEAPRSPSTERKDAAASTPDEQAIVREVQAFSEAWSRGDAKAAASFYTEEGVRVGASGDAQKGRVEIQAAYDKLLHGPFAGAKITQERGTVRLLAPDLAVWQGGMEILPRGGNSTIKGYVVQVMKKVDGRWLVLEAHPKLFPPPSSR